MHESRYDVLGSYEGFDFFWGGESQVLAWVADPGHVVRSHPSSRTVLVPRSVESETETQGETGFKVQFVMPLICALCAVRINIVSFWWILFSYMNFKQTFSQRNLPFYCLSGSCPHHNPWPSINTDRTLLQLHCVDTSQDPAHSPCPEN